MGRVIGIEFGSMRAVSVVAEAGSSCEQIAGTASVVMPLHIYFGPDGGIAAGAEAVGPAAADRARGVVGVRQWLADPGWRFEVDGASFAAGDLATLLFQRIALEVGAVETGVVTVPAYAHCGQRACLRDAACGAGLPVVRLLNEPTAAAAAYAWTAGLRGHVLVVGLDRDFDASVLRVVSPTEIEVLATDGEQAGAGAISSVEAERAIGRAFRTAGLSPAKLDGLVVHGEGAADPRAVGFVSGIAGRSAAEGIDPAELVARGAAMYAAHLAVEARTAA